MQLFKHAPEGLEHASTWETGVRVSASALSARPLVARLFCPEGFGWSSLSAVAPESWDSLHCPQVHVPEVGGALWCLEGLPGQVCHITDVWSCTSKVLSLNISLSILTMQE